MRNIFLTIFLILLLVPAGVHALVNINTADVTLLDTLPGIGPSKAAAIVDYRTANGPFARVEDIDNVKGIGPTILAEIKTLITVDVETKNLKLSQPSRSTNGKQADVSATVTRLTNPEHAVETVSAPGTTSELAGPGALVPTVSDPATETRTSGMFRSPWTLGFLGIVILAGATLLIL